MLGRLSVLGLALLPLALAANEPCALDRRSDDEKLLRRWKIEPTGPGLLAYLRSQAPNESERRALERQIWQLGSDHFPERERASETLSGRGVPALPYLRRALGQMDPEISRRARACITQIENGPGPAVPIAALRLLATDRQPGAVQAVLAYVPFIEDESVEDQAIATLIALAANDQAALIDFNAALTSPEPACRAAAVAVLGRLGDIPEKSCARQLLADPNCRVRFRAAEALLARHDRSALPVLIGLVEESPLATGWRAEDILYRTAGETAPAVSIGLGHKDDRKRAAAAWLAWYDRQSQRIDFSALESPQRLLGFTLVAELDSNRVWESGPDGKPRWKIENLDGPIDAQVLPNGHVLIAESHGQRITERDLRGTILWQKHLGQNPVTCRRLANGNTFVATYQSAFEITRDGQEVNPYSLPAGFMFGAEKLDNGRLVYITAHGAVLEVDEHGREIHSIPTRHLGGWCSVEALPGGHYLVALSGNSEMLELDARGQTVWRCTSVVHPCFASRLPNGHTLACSMGARRTGGNQRIVEVDQDGKIVWELKTDGRPFRAHRR
jgi:HEAT repeat protein